MATEHVPPETDIQKWVGGVGGRMSDGISGWLGIKCLVTQLAWLMSNQAKVNFVIIYTCHQPPLCEELFNLPPSPYRDKSH